MWVLSVDAGSLLSVVKFDVKKAGAKKLADKHGATDPEVDYLLIRARVKASLGYVADVLEALYAGEVEGWARPIIESMPSADYKYRTIITRDEWKKYLLFEVDGIDYDSHVKEETVRRQPEPKVANLYSALSATWSAWAKLQDTPPYGGSTWAKKPDCKNCNHTELQHTLKGDKCNAVSQGKQNCTCTKYEPKPVAKATPAKGAVGESQADPPLYAPLKIDYSLEGQGIALEDADGVHPDWCTFHDGDVCICPGGDLDEHPSLAWDLLGSTDRKVIWSEDDPEPELASTGSYVNGVLQEGPVAGETKRQRKARNERNRRRRKAAEAKAS